MFRLLLCLFALPCIFPKAFAEIDFNRDIRPILSDHCFAAATLDVDATALRLRANIGFWTALVALTATDRLAVDSLMLSDLSPECVRAYIALCASQDVGPLCEAFQPGRKAALAGICGRLQP